MKFRRRVEEVGEEEEGEAALFLIGGSEKSERLFLGYTSRLLCFFIKERKTKKKNTQIAIAGALPLIFIKRGKACIMPFHFKCLRLQEDRVGDHGE